MHRDRATARVASIRFRQARATVRALAQIGAVGVCAARKTHRRMNLFSGIARCACRRRMRVARHRAPPARMRMHDRRCVRNTEKKALSLPRARCPARRAASHAAQCARRDAARWAPRRGWRLRNICDKVLTAEKTVIRFRPNQGSQPQRVGSIKKTTHADKQCSARLVMTVDAGVVSFDKTHDLPDAKPASLRQAGFFMEAGHRDRRGRRLPHQIRCGAPGALAVSHGSDTRGGFHWAAVPASPLTRSAITWP